MAISKLSIIKFLELALTCVCLGLHYDTFFGGKTYEQIIVTGTFFGYAIILIGGFSGHLMSTPVARRIDIFYCLLGCALFIASGAFCIKVFDDYSGEIRHKGLAKGALAIINGAVFLLDALFTWRGEY